MSAHKQIIGWGGLVMVFLLGVLQGPESIVGVPTAHALASGVFDNSTQTAIANLVSQAVQYLNVGAWSLFVLITMLLTPSFIFDLGTGGGLITMLNQIWQLARDLMNVIFAFMLIAAAIYTIIKADKSFISENVGKFMLAVVLVNFSWFFPRVILDIANVSMTAIYGIPSLITNECHQVLSGKWTKDGVNAAVPVQPTNGTKLKCVRIPDGKVPGKNPDYFPQYSCDCEVIESAAFFVSNEDVVALKAKDARWECEMKPLLCLIKTKLDPTTQSSVTTTLNGLVINHARLGTLGGMPAPIGAGGVGELIAFVMREVLVLLIHIAIFFPLLAMAVAFLIRVPMLWITIAFMPFYFLSYLPFMDKILANFDPKEKIMKTFLSAAFLPAMTAVPLAVGYVLINAALLMPMGPLNEIRFPLIAGIGSFFQIMWLAIALGVMWMGVFGVLKNAGGFIESLTGKIRDIGSSAGQAVAKLPLHVPLPVPGGGKTSPLALAQNFDPRRINAALSRPEGLEELRKKFGKEPPATVDPKILEKIEKGFETDEKKAALKTKVDKAADTGKKEDISILIKEVKDKSGASVDSANIVEVLKELRKKDPDKYKFDDLKLDELKKKIEEIEKTEGKKIS
jgi:hypothetical protein